MEEYNDLLDEIKELASFGVSLSAIAQELNISPERAMGLVGILRNQGVNVVVVNKADGVHLLNQGDWVYKIDYNYAFQTDDENKRKFLVISDTRLGSVFSQLSILNELYLHAYKQGVRKVIHAGNITEGLYPMSNNMIETLVVRDTIDQAKYVIKNYPYIEGMKTYFITGKKDNTHLSVNKIDIGKRISQERKDLVCIGNGRCTVHIDNTEMFVLNRNQRKTYTQSYRAQKMIDAMRSEDRPSILIYGGLLQCEKFQYRDVKILSAPSVCATTWEMEEKEYSNTVGGWIMEVQTDKRGKLLSYRAYDDIYYNTFDHDCEKAKILRMEGDK